MAPTSLPRAIARQLCIGIQRDHVLDIGQFRGFADNPREGIRRGAAQKCIQIAKFAALAFITHPQALLRIPTARAVKQKEACATVGLVPRIQICDSLYRQIQQRFILRLHFLGGVSKIRQQGEVHVLVPIRQEPYLQLLD